MNVKRTTQDCEIVKHTFLTTMNNKCGKGLIIIDGDVNSMEVFLSKDSAKSLIENLLELYDIKHLKLVSNKGVVK